MAWSQWLHCDEGLGGGGRRRDREAGPANEVSLAGMTVGAVARWGLGRGGCTPAPRGGGWQGSAMGLPSCWGVDLGRRETAEHRGAHPGR